MMMEVIVFDFFSDMNRYRLLFNNFFNDFFLFDDDWLVMMMDVLYFGVRMFVMVCFDGNMNYNSFFMIAEKNETKS